MFPLIQSVCVSLIEGSRDNDRYLTSYRSSPTDSRRLRVQDDVDDDDDDKRRVAIKCDRSKMLWEVFSCLCRTFIKFVLNLPGF